MEPTPELLRILRSEEIADARHLPIERKLVLGGELFDTACEVTLSGIRIQNPEISSENAREILRSRLELSRRMESLNAGAKP